MQVQPEEPVSCLCREIEERRTAALERRIESYPRTQPIASDLGPCTREMVLAITNWKDRPAPDVSLKARFERGSAIENIVIQEMSQLGYEVRKDRRPFEIKDARGRVVLRGKIDGFVRFEGKDYPMEVKSLNPNIFERVECVSDFYRWSWAAKYPLQLMAYLYSENIEHGFFALDDCMGHWKLLPLALDYAAMEQILKRCEQAVEHVQAGTLPDYHKDPEVCRRCWAFGRVCDPPLETQGLQLLVEPEFEQLLERRQELVAAHREYEALDKEAKARLKGQDGLVLGRFLIQGKMMTRHEASKPERTIEYWQTKIVATGEAE